MAFISGFGRVLGALALLASVSALKQGPWRAMPAAKRFLRPVVIGGVAGLQVLTGGLPGGFSGVAKDAVAADVRSVGEIAGSGFVFKDVLKIEAFDDPKIEGVSLYVSDFTRPITDRLQKDFFGDPGAASITCAARSNPRIVGKLSTAKDGEEILSEARSLFFKTLRVRRIYDEEAGNAVYVVYNTRLPSNDANKNRFKSSICAVHVETARDDAAAAAMTKEK